MDKYMKKSDVIAYIRKEAKEAQSAFDELGGESGIIAQAFNDLANDFSQGAVPYTTDEEAFAQIPSADVAQWISVKERLPRNYIEVLAFDAIDREMFLGAIGSSGEWEIPGYRTEVFNFTHWMPLPEPPKGGFEQ